MAYKPMTRKERIAAGEAVTPVTRDEFYAKQLSTGNTYTFTITNISEQGEFTVTTTESFAKAVEAARAGLPLRSDIVTPDGKHVYGALTVFTDSETEAELELLFSCATALSNLAAYTLLWKSESVALDETKLAEAT